MTMTDRDLGTHDSFLPGRFYARNRPGEEGKSRVPVTLGTDSMAGSITNREITSHDESLPRCDTAVTNTLSFQPLTSNR